MEGITFVTYKRLAYNRDYIIRKYRKLQELYKL